MGLKGDTGGKGWSDSGFIAKVKPRGLAGNTVSGEEEKERAQGGYQAILPENCKGGTETEKMGQRQASTVVLSCCLCLSLSLFLSVTLSLSLSLALPCHSFYPLNLPSSYSQIRKLKLRPTQDCTANEGQALSH